ncbi:DinB family protein [Aeoliella sp. SH292]|uniref:DinB family protein n=1 Tax=Aeoliella sp. SH292 TaxID=3454464 RepID=UPI003F9D55C7
MNALELVRKNLEFSFEWIWPLAEDLADSPMTRPRPDGGNHATWTMAHITHAHAGLTSMITGKPSPIESWGKQVAGGTQPVDDPSIYPAYADILTAYRMAHDETLALLETLSDEDLECTPAMVPEYLKDFPDFQAIGNLLVFIPMHDMSHRGQLADVRQVLGRKPFA